MSDWDIITIDQSAGLKALRHDYFAIMPSRQSFYPVQKVLLHERKRHTACRVASARYAAPVQTWDGVLTNPRKCEQTENITFPHPSDAGGNNVTKPSY